MLRPAWIVLRKELRETLRDPLVLFNAIVFPLVLLPLVLWATTQFALLQAGVAEDEPPRVALAGEWPAYLETPLLAEPVERAELPAPGAEAADPAEAAIRAGEVDAVARLVIDGEAYTVEIVHDSTRSRSMRARTTLADRVETLRAERLAQLAEARSLDLARLSPAPIVERDVSEAAEKWSEVLGEMLPIMVFVALMMAVVFPAVDTVAGERERGTVETTLVTAPRPAAVALGKIGAVLAIGLFAMLGNALAMGLTVVQFLITLGGGEASNIELSATALAWAVPPMLAAALMLVTAAVVVVMGAQSFKEGQQRASYLMFAGFIGAFYAQRDGETVDLIGALNPLTTPITILRDAVRGDLTAGPALVATAAHLVVAAALVFYAARRLRDERFLLGGPATESAAKSGLRQWLAKLGVGGASDRSKGGEA